MCLSRSKWYLFSHKARSGQECANFWIKSGLLTFFFFFIIIQREQAHGFQGVWINRSERVRRATEEFYKPSIHHDSTALPHTQGSHSFGCHHYNSHLSTDITSESPSKRLQGLLTIELGVANVNIQFVCFVLFSKGLTSLSIKTLRLFKRRCFLDNFTCSHTQDVSCSKNSYILRVT